MKKAVLLDFYGTIVHEAEEVLDRIAEEFRRAGSGKEPQEIHRMWWTGFARATEGANDKNFRLQKSLYAPVLDEMQRECDVCVDVSALVEKIIEFSVTSRPFEDSLRFLGECPLPCYILSNIDTPELEKMVQKWHLSPCGIFTSEMAREYKPRPGIFTKGLRAFGLAAEEVVYAGDSLRNDYYGARGAGIESYWLNRKNEAVPQGVKALPNLYSLIDVLKEQ